MLFVIESAFDCLCIKLDTIDVVRMEDSHELGAEDRFTINFYRADASSPVCTYNISALSIEDRHKLFATIVAYMRNPGPSPSTYVIC